MHEAMCYRLLAEAADDMDMYRNLLALLPWTVHVNRRRTRGGARNFRPPRIPSPRRSTEPSRRRPVQKGHL